MAIAVLAMIAVTVVVGHLLRSSLGLELSPEGLRERVAGTGWKAPALYLGLVTFRQFLMLPAILLLPIGGLCFGAALGTLLGASGILFSGLITFGMARGLGSGWLQAMLADRHVALVQHLERLGPPIVGLATAHPTGPMSAAFWGAGFSSMALLPFSLAVAIGGSVRALAYSFLGSTLVTGDSWRFQLAAAAIAVVAFAPFAHPRVRRAVLRLRKAAEEPEDGAPAGEPRRP
jgi:uncharacterized membrane protein YdjX (TVP38/TMEM64 family)